MDIVAFNAIIIPLFSFIIFAPALRDQKTGEYFGLRNIRASGWLIGFLIVQCLIVYIELGISWINTAKIVLQTAIMIAVTFAWLVYTQEKMFGTKFSLKPSAKSKKENNS